MQLGHYQVWEEIGRGGMGVVYRGYDPLIGREVALKTIHLYAIADPRERQEMQDRLQREAQSAGRLSHPNIVTIYQIGYAELQPGQTTAFLAMEFIPGANLAALLGSLRAGPPEQITGYLRQAAAGLDYAHSRGVIHRDIKPANLLVTPEGVLKIADFGVAKILSQTVTMTGAVLGSPAYMSPEQIKAEPIDGRTDQYSLAVVAYELFTGRKPFDADTLSSLVYKIAQQPPPPLENVPPPLAGQIGPVLTRALAKEPAARYGTCTEFVEALEAALQAPAAVKAKFAPKPAAAPLREDSSKPRTPARIPVRALGAAGAVCAGIALIAWIAVTLQDPAPRVQPPEAGQSASAKEAPDRPAGVSPAEPPATGMANPATASSPPGDPAPVARKAPPSVAQTAPVPAPQTASRKPAPPVTAQPALSSNSEAARLAAQKPASAAAKPEAQPQPPTAVAESKPAPASPPVTPPEAAPPPREPVRTPPRVLQRAPAAYTPEALQKGIEGAVLLSVDIDDQGIPRRARVLRSLDPALDRKAIESLGGWRFSPATEDGKAVPSTANVEVNFQLVGAPRRTPPSLKSLKK